MDNISYGPRFYRHVFGEQLTSVVPNKALIGKWEWWATECHNTELGIRKNRVMRQIGPRACA